MALLHTSENLLQWNSGNTRKHLQEQNCNHHSVNTHQVKTTRGYVTPRKHKITILFLSFIYYENITFKEKFYNIN